MTEDLLTQLVVNTGAVLETVNPRIRNWIRLPDDDDYPAETQLLHTVSVAPTEFTLKKGRKTVLDSAIPRVVLMEEVLDTGQGAKWKLPGLFEEVCQL